MIPKWKGNKGGNGLHDVAASRIMIALPLCFTSISVVETAASDNAGAGSSDRQMPDERPGRALAERAGFDEGLQSDMAQGSPLLLGAIALLALTYLFLVQVVKSWFYRHHALL